MTGDVQSCNRLPSYIDPQVYGVDVDAAVTEEGLVRGEYGRYYVQYVYMLKRIMNVNSVT